MKMIWKYGFVLLAGLALTLACSKETDLAESGDNTNPTEQPGDQPQAKMVTITVSMPEEGLTKIAFEQDPENKDGAVKLTWEEGDKILVNGEEFTLVSGAGTQTAGFSGPEVTADSYTIAYNGGAFGATQHQAADADTGHLAYIVSLTGVNTYQDVEFTQTWATANGGGTLTQSSIFRLRAQMPAGVAEDVVAVKILAKDADDAPVNIFGGGNELTVMIDEAGDADEDGILDIYANLPTTAAAIPAGTAFFVRFMTTARGSAYSYTRYHVFSSALELTPGKVNALKLNCTATDKHAGNKSVCDGSAAAKAYLIGDGYQLAAINTYASTAATTFIKMIDNVDMTGITHTPINDGISGYAIKVNFDGNHKTVSNLGKHLFYVFKGSIYDLTLDGFTVTARGIFAEYCQGTGHTITNVDISNSTLTNTSANVAALIGRVNSGTSGVVSVTVSDCDITNTTVKGGAQTGGLLGGVDVKVEVANCSVSKAGSGTSSVTATGDNCGGLIGRLTVESNISNCSVSGTNVTGTTIVGGVIGYVNSASTVSGCKYTGGTVKATDTYCGGMLGSTGNYATVITDCHVEDATITSTDTDDARIGGFVGQLQTSVQVKGCTVGTESKKVVVNTAQPASEKVLNAGGFVGVNYGTITKNGDVRCKAYAQIKSANTLGQQINIGGFAGFHRGTIEYCDAVVDMSDLQGQYIGGFSGYFPSADSHAEHCTVKGSIKGNNYTGGFVGVVINGLKISDCQVLEGTVVVGQSTAGGFAGQIRAAIVEDCSAHVDLQCRGGNDGGFVGAITGGTVQRCSSAGTLSQISGTNNVFGGFAGYVNGVDLTKCSSTVNISVARSYVGGLIGDHQTANTVSECFYNGTISGPTNTKGGLIGTTQAAAVITNCYTAGEIVASSGTQIYGGIVGELKAGGSVTNCYSTMDMTHGGRAMGGIVGRACSGGWPVSNASNNTISKCIAWNPHITYDGNASTSASCGAIIGYTSFKNILNNCYRRYDMVYKNSNTAVGTTCQTSMVDQVDCDGTNWAINGNRPAGGTPAGTSADAQYQAPYYGVAAASTATVSSIAQTLGWSSDVWDFTGDLPTLK